MALARPEDGRIGDIWRITGRDNDLVVIDLDARTVIVNDVDVSSRQSSGWGFDLRGWDTGNNVLYRFREDLSQVQVGDIVRLYVPPTDIYLLDVRIDIRWPLLSVWFGYQVGRAPEPDVEDSGLQFHPSVDETFDCERLFRPFAMLPEGAQVREAQGRLWRFTPPFWFMDEDGARGEPVWPVELPGDEAATEALHATSPAEQMAAWQQQSGVELSAFDYKSPR